MSQNAVGKVYFFHRYYILYIPTNLDTISFKGVVGFCWSTVLRFMHIIFRGVDINEDETTNVQLTCAAFGDDPRNEKCDMICSPTVKSRRFRSTISIIHFCRKFLLWFFTILINFQQMLDDIQILSTNITFIILFFSLPVFSFT